MMSIIIGWWLALTEPTPPDHDTVTAATTARGATFDYAFAECQFRCTRQLSEQCRDRKLLPPVYPTIVPPECFESFDGMHVCSVNCAGECAEPAPVESEDDE